MEVILWDSNRRAYVCYEHEAMENAGFWMGKTESWHLSASIPSSGALARHPNLSLPLCQMWVVIPALNVFVKIKENVNVGKIWNLGFIPESFVSSPYLLINSFFSPLRVLLWSMTWCLLIVLLPQEHFFVKRVIIWFPLLGKVKGLLAVFTRILQHESSQDLETRRGKKFSRLRWFFTEKATSSALIRNFVWKACLSLLFFWLMGGPGICSFSSVRPFKGTMVEQTQ